MNIIRPARIHVERTVTERRRSERRRYRHERGSSLIEVVVAMGVASTMLGVCLATIHLLMRVEQDATKHMWYRTTLSRLQSQLRADIGSATSADVDEVGRRLELQLPAAAPITWTVTEAGIERHRQLDGDRAQHEIFRLPAGSEAGMERTPDSSRVTVRIVHRWAGGLKDPSVIGEQAGREVVFAATAGTRYRFDATPDGN